MIKRTLYFGNPAYLNIHLNQLVVSKPGEEHTSRIPIEDIGIVLLDHAQITITHGVLRSLQENKVAIISCDEKHMPKGLLLPLESNTLQSKIQRIQLAATEPLKKNLWQQVVTAKISNQANLLEKLGKNHKRLTILKKRVLSGDPKNIEAQAAIHYWAELFEDFKRERYGDPPNHMLNYGYAILRSMVARALLSSGLSAGHGIFHKNQYNAFCLADDIMEPYRPFVDQIVYHLYDDTSDTLFMSSEDRKQLLAIATFDVLIRNKKSPLMVALSQTTKSLADCFEGTRRKLVLPVLT